MVKVKIAISRPENARCSTMVIHTDIMEEIPKVRKLVWRNNYAHWIDECQDVLLS